MLNVECEGCRAPYEIEERRIPAAGLRVRCKKCGTAFWVKPAASKPSDDPTELVWDSVPPAVQTPREVPKQQSAPSEVDLPAISSGQAPRAVAAGGRDERARRPASADLPSVLDREVGGRTRAARPAPQSEGTWTRSLGSGEASAAGVSSADLDTEPPPTPQAPAPHALELPEVLVRSTKTRPDLPAVLGSAAKPPGKAELPAVLGGGGKATAELPAVLGGGGKATAELPAVLGGGGKATVELPAVFGGGGKATAELPAVFGGGGKATVELPAVLGGGAKSSVDPTASAVTLVGMQPEPTPAKTVSLPPFLAETPELPRDPAKATEARPAGPVTLSPRPPSATRSTGFGELELPLLSGIPGAGSVPPGPPAQKPLSLAPTMAEGAPRSLPARQLDSPPSAGAEAVASDGWLSLPPECPPAEGVGGAVGGDSLPPIEPHRTSGEFSEAPNAPDFGEIELAAPSLGRRSPAQSPARSLSPAVADGAALGIAAGSEPVADEALDDLTDVAKPWSSAPPETGGSDRPPVEDEMEFGALPQQDTSEFALESRAPGAARVAATAEPGASTVAEPVRRSSKLRLAAAGVTVLALLGGASLEVVSPYGAFARHLVSDWIHADQYRALAASSVQSARTLLAEDVFVAATQAITATDDALVRAPRVHGLAAYSAFLGYLSELRFGRGPAVEAHARQQLGRFPEDKPTAGVELARAAEAAAGSQLPRARQLVETLAQEQPGDPDVAVLAGELALVAKEPARALESFQRAERLLGADARTAFGVARAHLAIGSEAAAQTAARGVLARSPRHAGARVLLARILWSKADEQGALELLAEVTTDGPTRKAASPSEVVEALTLASRVHMARSRMSQAEAALAEALRIDPKSASALAGMGEVLYGEGRYTEALARFDAGVQADPEGGQSKVGSAKAKIALERLQEAKEQLKKLRDARPGDFDVNYWLGRAEEGLADRAAADRAYREAIRAGGSRPDTIDAYVALAQLLTSDGRPQEAEVVLADAQHKLAASPVVHRGLGEVHLQAGRFDLAKSELESALAQDPDDLAARFELATALRRMGRFPEAAAEYERIAARDKQYPGLALERGLLYEATNQTREALEYYQEALSKAPDDADLMLRVGSAEVSSGHASAAEDILRKVILRRPNSAEVNHYLGRALLLKGTNLTEALRHLRRATEIDPNRAEFHLYVGWAANDAGQAAVARDALERALELDKGLADAYWQKAELLRKQGAVVDAMYLAQKALELRPTRYEAYATLAQCFEDQNRVADAIASWRKAIAQQSDVPEWHYRLGKLLGRGGLPELAKAVQFAEAVDAKPGWFVQAYFELGEAEQAAGKRADAIQHFRRYLTISKPDAPYRTDAKKVLEALGARYED